MKFPLAIFGFNRKSLYKNSIYLGMPGDYFLPDLFVVPLLGGLFAFGLGVAVGTGVASASVAAGCACGCGVGCFLMFQTRNATPITTIVIRIRKIFLDPEFVLVDDSNIVTSV